MSTQGSSVEDMTWWAYVQQHSGGDTNIKIANRLGVTPPSIGRWSKGTLPDPTSAAAFARAYDRPVLEAFLAAGYLTPEEADQKPTAAPSLAELSDDDLLDEVRRRMKGGQSGWSATRSPEDDSPDAGGASLTSLANPYLQDQAAQSGRQSQAEFDDEHESEHP